MKKILAVGIVILAIAISVFYFRNDLANLYLTLTRKISGIQNMAPQNLVEEIKTQVIAPPPLRSIKEITGQTVLTDQGVISQTNSQRAANGLAALKENEKLDSAALAKVQDMFKNQYFEHENPKTGAGPDVLAQNAGYEFILIGENLALGNYADDKALLQAWMDSPGHRANILNKNFQDIGVAVMKGAFEGRTTWLAVQEFGLPLSVCQQPSAPLKAQVDANERQLTDLNQQIDAQHTKLDSLSNRNPAYAQNAAQYNDLVGQYNTLLAQTKILVEQYNDLVNSFNQCASSF